jgi:hypothetical protein
MPDQNTDFYVDYSNSTVVINSCDSILVQRYVIMIQSK